MHTFLDEIGNVEVILISILTFLRKCMGAAIMKIAVDFYLRRKESVLQVDRHQPGLLELGSDQSV